MNKYFDVRKVDWERAMRVIKEKQDLTYLHWSHARASSGTAGTLLKSESNLGGIKRYYKLSNFDYGKGVIGHECINEIIVDRLLTLLGVEHLDYELVNADILIEGKQYTTYLCSSLDFKKPGESKTALDDYFRLNAEIGESRYDFCARNGWKQYVDQMLALDYIILNRDRHGANIEILRNSKKNTIRIAPMFDHGLSLIFSCGTEEDVKTFDILKDRRCNNFIGTSSCYENLLLLKGQGDVFRNKLKFSDKSFVFEGLEDIIPAIYIDTIWEMIFKRYIIYENI